MEDEATRLRAQLRHYQGNYRDACKLAEESMITLAEYKEAAEAKIKQLEAALDQAKRDGDRALERLAKAVHEREEALERQAAAVGRFELAIEERNIALARIEHYEQSGYLPQSVKDEAAEKINRRGRLPQE